MTINDAAGLQSNGTGLVSDTLVLSYGSALGNPASVTWYYNDAVVKAYTNQQGNLTEALALNTAGATAAKSAYVTATNPALANCKDGKYYAVIVNTEGKAFTSNEISLVYDEEKAVVSSFALSDDLKNTANITYAANDATAIVTVKMPKVYDGTFYVYEEGVTSYTVANSTALFPYVNGTTLTAVTTADKMTEKNCLDATVAGANGIQFTDEFGVTTMMFKVGATVNTKTTKALVRGKKYKVVFDQASASTHINTIASKDFTASDPIEMPYLTAPAGIELVTVASGAKATANLIDKDGAIVSYIGDPTANTKAGSTFTEAGFASVYVYGSSSAAESTDVKAQGGNFKSGVWTSTGNLGSASFYQAVAKTLPGVYGAEAVTLKSAFKAANIAIASSLTVAENGTTPSQADITVGGVVAPATVYVVAARDEATKGAFDPTDSSTFRGSVKVEAAASSATVAGVFTKDDLGTKFTAYLIPDDTKLYSTLTSDEMTLKQVATSLEFDGTKAAGLYTNTALPAAAGSNVLTATPVVVKDQFGSDISATYYDGVTAAKAEVKAVDKGTTPEAATATYTVAANGALSVTVTRTSGVDLNDGFDISLLGTTITMRNVLPATDGTAANVKPFIFKMGTSTIASPAVAADSTTLTVTNLADFKKALAGAGATAITLGGSFTIAEAIAPAATQDVTIAAGNTITISPEGSLTAGKALTVNGELKNNGKVNVGDGANHEIEGAGTFSGTGTYTFDNTTAAKNKSSFQAVMAGTTGFTAKVDEAVTTDAKVTVSKGQTVEIKTGKTFTLGDALDLNGTVTNNGVFAGAAKVITLGDGSVFASVATNDDTSITGGSKFILADTTGTSATIKDITANKSCVVKLDTSLAAGAAAVASEAVGTTATYTRKAAKDITIRDDALNCLEIAIVAD